MCLPVLKAMCKTWRRHRKSRPRRIHCPPVIADTKSTGIRQVLRPLENTAATTEQRMLPLAKPSDAQLRLLLVAREELERRAQAL